MLVPSESMRELLEARLREYQIQFQESPEALTYWENRGLTRKTAEEFRVGFVASPLKGDGWFKNRLAIPYITANGRPVSFKFRAIDDTADRYRKDKGDPSRLFNTRALVKSYWTVVTEGEIDAIAAGQCGLPAVGIPGATQWKTEWSRVFRNRTVLVLADGDDAGEEFAEKVANFIYGCRVISMPPGEDVCSMLKAKGEEWIREVVLE